MQITITCDAQQLARVLTLADERVHTSPEIETAVADDAAITTILDLALDAQLAL